MASSRPFPLSLGCCCAQSCLAPGSCCLLMDGSGRGLGDPICTVPREASPFLSMEKRRWCLGSRFSGRATGMQGRARLQMLMWLSNYSSTL